MPRPWLTWRGWFKIDAGGVGEADKGAGPCPDGVFEGDGPADEKRQRIRVSQDKLQVPVYSFWFIAEPEGQQQPDSGTGDREQRQLAELILQDDGTFVGDLAFRAYPAASVHARPGKPWIKVAGQDANAPHGALPPQCLRLSSWCGFRLLLPPALSFCGDGLSHALPVRTWHEEVPFDGLSVIRTRVRGPDVTQPRRAPYDSEFLSASLCYGTKSVAESSVFAYCLYERAAHMPQCNVVDKRIQEALPVRC